MLARSFRLTRLAGIDVRLDSSLLLFALLVAWVFGASFLARHGAVTTVTMALLATALFLASVLAHELAHGLEARYRGIRVEGITLFFFGGMTEMRAASRSPRDEFAVSAVGPYASLVCAAVFGLLATLAQSLGPVLAGPVGDVAGLLAWLNLFLAAFNLVPGAPLDGGRVLRAGLWWLLDDRYRAVRIAARAGAGLAAGLGVAGLWMVATGLGLLDGLGPSGLRRFTDSPVMGAVLLMLGAFIFRAARAELAHGELENVLDHHRVADLLGAPGPVVDHDRPLDLVEPAADRRTLPVVDGTRLVGVLSAQRVGELHPTDRAARTVAELMEPVGELPAVDVAAPLRELVDHLLDGHALVLVRSDGRPVALLGEPEVAHGLHRLRRDGRPAAGLAPQTQGTTP